MPDATSPAIDDLRAHELCQELARVLAAHGNSRALRLLMQFAHEYEPRRPAPGFNGVWWDGEYYPFTDRQARVVRVLWRAWQQRTPDVSDGILLRAAGSTSDKLSNVFSGNSAWGALIVPGPYRGTFRLAC